MSLHMTTVDWADLVTLDLSQFDLPGGKQKLANQLKDAVHKVGKSRLLPPPPTASHDSQDSSISPTTASRKPL